VLYEGLRQNLGEVFRRLAEQKESRVLEGQPNIWFAFTPFTRATLAPG
jgi:hypothetical protein